jgi:hypothetical protein
VFFGGDRAGEVKTALDSMVVYDQWQQTGDYALLDQIAAYNEADCRSLLMCRDWLLRLRPPDDVLIAETLAPAGKIVYSFRFPAQDFKMSLGIDEDKFEIALRRGKNREPLPRRFSLIPKGPLGDKVLRAAIARYIGAVLEGDEDRYAAITGILRRGYPRFQGLIGIGNDPDEVARAIDAIGRLDHSHLLIQGPPGAGKTFAASHAIVEMLARGKRVGVSSHSRKAINNLLQAVETAAADRGLRFRGIKKSSYEEQFLHGSIIEDTTDNSEAADGGYDLIAGTAWLFAREELDQQIDCLFVDEAGQVSLANTVAMGVSARNVILVATRCSSRSRSRVVIRGGPAVRRSTTCSTVPRPSRPSVASSSARRDGCTPICAASYPMRSMMADFCPSQATNGAALGPRP